MAVTRGGPQISPSGVLLGFLLGLDGLLDLGHFEFDQRASDVATSVKVGQVLACLINTVNRYKPAGRFGDHDQAGDTDEREEYLKQRWHPPCPATCVVAGTKGCPGCNYGSEVPTAIVLSRMM